MRSMRRLAVSAAASLGFIAGVAPALALTPGSVVPLAQNAPNIAVKADWYCGPGYYLNRWGECVPYYYGYGWYGYGFPYYRYHHHGHHGGNYRFYRNFDHHHHGHHGGHGHGHGHGGHGHGHGGHGHGHGHGGHGHGGHGHGGHGHGH